MCVPLRRHPRLPRVAATRGGSGRKDALKFGVRRRLPGRRSEPALTRPLERMPYQAKGSLPRVILLCGWRGGCSWGSHSFHFLVGAPRGHSAPRVDASAGSLDSPGKSNSPRGASSASRRPNPAPRLGPGRGATQGRRGAFPRLRAALALELPGKPCPLPGCSLSSHSQPGARRCPVPAGAPKSPGGPPP